MQSFVSRPLFRDPRAAGSGAQRCHGRGPGVSGVLDEVPDKIDSLGLLFGMCVLVYLQSMPVIGWMVVG